MQENSNELDGLQSKNNIRLYFKVVFFLFLILLLGFALRSYRLDTLSLWIDEYVTTYKLYLAPSLADFFSLFIASQSDQVPLSHLIYFFIFRFTSLDFNEIDQLRWVSVGVGLANLVLLFFMVRMMFGNRIALLATLLLAVSPYHILYSQLIRPYVFYECSALLSLWVTLLFLRSPTVVRGILWVLTGVFVISFHYTGILLLLVEMSFLFIRYVRGFEKVYLLFPGLMLSCFAFVWRFFSSRTVPIYTKEDDFVMGFPSVFSWLANWLADDAILTSEPFFFQGQRVSFLPEYWLRELVNIHSWFDGLLLVLSAFSVGYSLYNFYLRYRAGNRISNDWSIPLLVAVVLLPQLALTILTFLVWPCMQSRYTLYSSLALYPLLAFTMMNLKSVRVRNIVTGWIILGMGYQCFLGAVSQKTTDFRSAGHVIRERCRSDEPIYSWGIFFLATPITNEILAYYSGMKVERIQPVYSLTDVMDVARAQFKEKKRSSMWLVIEPFVFSMPKDHVIECNFQRHGIGYEKYFFPGMNGIWLYRLFKKPDTFQESRELILDVEYEGYKEVLTQVGLPVEMEGEIEQKLRKYIDFVHPATPMIWNYMAWCALDREDVVWAEWFARCAIALQPNTPWGYHSLAVSLLEQNRPQEALSALEQCIRNDPSGVHDIFYKPLIDALYIKQDRLQAQDWIRHVEARGGFVQPFYRRKACLI